MKLSIQILESLFKKTGPEGHSLARAFREADDSRIAWAWFFLSWILFLIGISRFEGTIFDEYHYIGEVKRIFSSDQLLMNHPPLGKLLIRLGIEIFGDRPLGWRFMSTVFGAGIVAATYAIARQLFGSKKAGHTAAALTLSNGLLWSMARVGMLDIFCAGFSMLGVWAALPYLDPSATFSDWTKMGRKRLILSIFLVSAAWASKWNGFLLASPICLILLRNLYKTGQKRYFWISVGWIIGILIIAYLFFFLPLVMTRADFPSILEVIRMHPTWLASHALYAREHEYMSAPHQWPTLIQPLWLAFQQTTPGYFRGVFCVGNPALFLAGLVALVFGFVPTVTRSWSERDRWSHRLLVVLWFWTWAGWYVIPRQIQFFYYYLFPSLMLPLMLAKFLENRAKWTAAFIAIGLFFYPVFASLELSENSIVLWSWLERWI